MNRLLTSGCSPSSDILDLRRTGTPTVFLLCCGPSPLCLVAASSWREQVLGYKCAEDKLESTVGLALAAFQALTPALIIANRGQNWVGAVHLHWNWKLLPLKLCFFFFPVKIGIWTNCTHWNSSLSTAGLAAALENHKWFDLVCTKQVFTHVSRVEGDGKSLSRNML